MVTKDIPADSVAVGNPAKVIKKLGEAERKYWQAQKAKYLAAKEKFNSLD